ESQGKKLHVILEMKKTSPDSHYLMLVVRGDKLKENRDAYVHTVAAMIDAARFMKDPKNADTVAEAATPTGHPKDVNKAALKEVRGIDLGRPNTAGPDRHKLEATIALMKKIGGIQPGKDVIAYDKLVDLSVWRDAVALLKK